MSKNDNIPQNTSGIMRLYERAVGFWDYCSTGVWRDTRNTPSIKIIKTLSLVIRSFLSSNLQSKACALTYSTLLSIVPALALVFAIGRGFGLQNIISNQLFKYFPSQHKALETALRFVDSYLNQASEGVFVGIGIIFLMWTLISLLGSVEDTFNTIWQVRTGRSLWRKVTDYTAIFLVLPILMICASGLSLFMSNTLQSLLPSPSFGPIITAMLDGASFILTWFFFCGAYMLIPNAKVRFVNALIAGIAVGTAFQILQWIFITGQMYVAKYNAIYGSFSFLPLMLIWMQLTWLITLTGALICYASQSIGQFNFADSVKNITECYKREATLGIMAIIAKRFQMGKSPITVSDISNQYGLPLNLVTSIVLKLHKANLINFIQQSEEYSEHPLQPAMDVSDLSVGMAIERLQNVGESDFIPDFDKNFASAIEVSNHIFDAMTTAADNVLITSIEIDIKD